MIKCITIINFQDLKPGAVKQEKRHWFWWWLNIIKKSVVRPLNYWGKKLRSLLCANPEQMLLENAVDVGPSNGLCRMKVPILGQTWGLSDEEKVLFWPLNPKTCVWVVLQSPRSVPRYAQGCLFHLISLWPSVSHLLYQMDCFPCSITSQCHFPFCFGLGALG